MGAKLSSVQNGEFFHQQYMKIIFDKAEEMVTRIKNHDRSDYLKRLSQSATAQNVMNN